MLRDPALRAGRKLKSQMNCSLLIAAPPLPSAPIGISEIRVSGGACQLSPTAVASLREGCKHLPGRRRRRSGGSRGHPSLRPHRARTAPASLPVAAPRPLSVVDKNKVIDTRARAGSIAPLRIPRGFKPCPEARGLRRCSAGPVGARAALRSRRAAGSPWHRPRGNNPLPHPQVHPCNNVLDHLLKVVSSEPI